MLMRRRDQTVQIDARLLPEPDAAVQSFEAHGGHITVFSPFGRDPLADRPDLIGQREIKFLERYPDFAPFFYSVVNCDYSLFHAGLLFFIELSKHIEAGRL